MTEPTTPADDEDVSGLKAKNADLLKKLKAAEKRAADAETAKAEAEETAINASADELTKANNRIKKLEADLETANTRAVTAEKAHSTYKAETAIAQAIASNNVESHHTPILTSHFKTLIGEDGTIEGQAVTDYAKAFFAKDGAHYCRAANNSGGGATGGDSTAAPRMTKENFNYTEFARIQLENPAEANAIADAVGKPELKT